MKDYLTKDYRNTKNIEWFNNNYFIAIYDYYDDNIESFENINELAKKYNLTKRYIFKALRTQMGLEIHNSKIYMYVFKKTKINENYKRTK